MNLSRKIIQKNVIYKIQYKKWEQNNSIIEYYTIKIIKLKTKKSRYVKLSVNNSNDECILIYTTPRKYQFK